MTSATLPSLPTTITCAGSRPKLGEAPHPDFGGAQAIYNVIDSRQADPQANVIEALRGLGYTEAAAHYVHFSYEMVALTPRCALELGYQISEEDRGRPYIEVSGRKGFGVKADALLDKLTAAAKEEVDSRHPQRSQEERQDIAHQIAVGALRYFMLKFTRNTVIAFDFKEALSFEGETGPYVQYAVVRARNIFRKAGTTPEAALAEVNVGDYFGGRRSRRSLGAVDHGFKAQPVARAMHCRRRTCVSGQACFPAGAAIQQFLSPPSHPHRRGSRAQAVSAWPPPRLPSARWSAHWSGWESLSRK